VAAQPDALGADAFELVRRDRARLVLRLDGVVVEGAAEAIPLEDGRLRGVWGERLWRLTLRPSVPVAQGEWRLMVRAERL
jgi:hypothetical protein